MRILKTKAFGRFQHKERIDDETLLDTVMRAERGLIDADLGAGLIKQRVARAGAGRSGGFRTVIAYKSKSAPYFSTVLPRAGWLISARRTSETCATMDA